MSKILEIKDLIVGYGRKNILEGINLSFEKPQFVVLIGENGSGKTTLLRAILGFFRKKQGTIKIYGKEISEISPNELAGLISFIPQISSPLNGFTVFEVVEMARASIRATKKEHLDIVNRSLERMDLTKIKDKFVTDLSGGEYQKVLFARALAQQAKIMLLDEPTAHLDIKNKIHLLSLINELKGEKLIISVMHDLDRLKENADRAIFIKNGQLFLDGLASAVLTKENIDKVFDLEDAY